jgi:hypothetical protein
MDKSAIDQSKEEGQTSKPSVGSSTVLNILKRFRSRREDAEDREPSFDDRLGAASGPLAARISELSSLIEAGRSQGVKASEPQAADDAETTDETPQEENLATEDAAGTNAAGRSDTRPKTRVRSMGFHNPVFPAKPPDEPKDPDFVASTEPPVLKLHDAPDGVMENSGAPEKEVTPPKVKVAEPLDLRVFAEQVRANLPKPEPKVPATDESVGKNDETEADAAAFKEHFYSRISKASKASVFDAYSATQEPKSLLMPASIMNLEARGVTASTALQSWRKFQGDQKTEGDQIDHLDKPLRAVETDATQSVAKPANAEEPESQDHLAPDTETYIAEQELDQFDYPSFEPAFDDGETEPEQDSIAEDIQENAPEPVAEPEQEPEVDQIGEFEAEMLSDFEPEPPASETATDPGPDQEDEPEETLLIAPENVFDALDIDEEELLTKVYDVIEAELRAAWGENVTLNIRKIVREEVRAAVEKARSGT